MTGSKKRRRRGEIERPGAEHREHTDQTGTAVRLVMMTWEIVWTLVRGHVLRGTDPGRPP